jgi:hypothetical protein
MNYRNRPIKTVIGQEPYLIFEWPEGVPLPLNYIDGTEQLLGEDRTPSTEEKAEK